MPKHSAETRAKALEMLESEGARKTSRDMGITLNTLYRWRNEEKAKGSAPEESAAEAISDMSDKISAAKVVLSEYDASIAAENVKLTEEIAKLRAENNKLRNALKALLG